MPSVFVVPVYVEVPAGFERAISTLESHLRRAGYVFKMGEPMAPSEDSIMNESEEAKLRELAQQNICPNCGSHIEPGTRVMRGVGAFCGLDCIAEYQGAELIERHKKCLEAARRHRNS